MNRKLRSFLEYKKPLIFKPTNKRKKRLSNVTILCQELGSKIGIITDNIVTYWINPWHYDEKNSYNDRTTKKEEELFNNS